MEKERDEAKQKAKVARLAANATGDTRARVEDDLAWVQDALVAEKEGRRKAEEDLARVQEALTATGEGRRKA